MRGDQAIAKEGNFPPFWFGTVTHSKTQTVPKSRTECAVTLSRLRIADSQFKRDSDALVYQPAENGGIMRGDPSKTAGADSWEKTFADQRQ